MMVFLARCCCNIGGITLNVVTPTMTQLTQDIVIPTKNTIEIPAQRKVTKGRRSWYVCDHYMHDILWSHLCGLLTCCI